jgi:predicted DCC family thiol-disulfide oxidoreductase YuxK
VDQDGTIYRGLDAFLPLLPGLPGGRMLLALLRQPLLRPVGYVLYRLVARYRYRVFGQVPCESACPAPEDGNERTTGGQSAG